MKYVVDSHYVADFLKGCHEALTLFRQLVPSGISISIITYAEVYEGIYYGQQRAKYSVSQVLSEL